MHSLKGHTRRVQSIASDLSGKFLATASWDCSVRVWNLAKGECVCDLKVARWEYLVKFVENNYPSLKCHLMIHVHSDVNSSTLRDIFILNILYSFHYSPVNSVSFHPEGQLIVTGQWDTTIAIWDVFHKTRKAVRHLFIPLLLFLLRTNCTFVYETHIIQRNWKLLTKLRKLSLHSLFILCILRTNILL